MNQSVVKKMVKAKLLEYEALKEILEERMPEPMKEKAKHIENEMMQIAKELILERIMEKRGEEQEDCDDKEEKDNPEIKGQKTSKQKTRSKIEVQFGEESL